ncbi:hypothetical protein M2163_003798 [Streptomyces sp. SAI-135]|jgi:hypothetical protein|uniref:hypothetical protein n=1 Tax=unclassified Streptomyces TaxID=2593676 RepID=UPI002475EED3|nr:MULTISPECIES: hypothetical protein [unclassified Streptomyces]MDH6519218.1 hypothetical protein [Streptomyces sp. SAI-090]MDH6551440.1 hypothetical protein [Streptomyces sp. SAI-041]MDH6616690.1 hypothetical protein [Streptomyces sp. SAI-135]
MTRNARALLALSLLPVLLTGCGADKASGTGGAAADGAGLAAAAEDWGVEPELVYVTEVSGYTVFPASVGAYGDGEFAAAYRSDKGSTRIGLFADHSTLTAGNCAEQPLGADALKPVTCERDGKAWYRTAGGVHEYAVPRDGVVVRLIADKKKVDRSALREAAEAVHRPSDAELAALRPAGDGSNA